MNVDVLIIIINKPYTTDEMFRTVFKEAICRKAIVLYDFVCALACEYLASV